MKKFLSLFALMVMASGFCLAQSPSVKLYSDICRFYKSNTGEPYIQIYLAIPGTSISYQQEEDNMFQAKVNIDYSLERIIDGHKELYYSDTYNLQLPQKIRLPDTTLESRKKGNLIQTHSIALEPGKYLFRSVSTDSSAIIPSKDSTFIEFDLPKLTGDEIGFSDIKWVAGELEKGEGGRRFAGKDELIPQVSNSAFINEDFIVFYQEIYNADKKLEDNFLIRCVVYKGDNRLFVTETLGQGRPPRSVNAYKETIDISLLSSGTYHLQVELLNQTNRVAKTYREVFWVYKSQEDGTISIPLADNINQTEVFGEYTEKELDYYLQTLLYASSQQEQNFIKALENYDQKKNFLFSFFEKRRAQDKSIQEMWNGHLVAIDYVNQEFKSSFRPGWQTDRGRVFIKYGIPYDVERHPSKANLLPYEIWRYNRLGSQTNVVFIFFDPDLATNEYPLLHSTKYGEVNNPRWRSQLTSDVDSGVDFERNRTRRFKSDLEIDD
ncbi:MAG: GWxTD domain-containing protein [Bacteroidota bacterium]